MSESNLPDFLIAGAAKGGTTSLYHYLRQHPEVFLPDVKEPCFLCYADNKPAFKMSPRAVFTFDEYKNLFAGTEKYKRHGEATALYLYLHETAIENIKKFIPDYEHLKIVLILRNPAERAFSQYMNNVRDSREELSFEDAIAAEPDRIRANINTDFYYLARGFYYSQVKAFMDNFENVKVYLFDELRKNPEALVKDLCVYLEINPDVEFKLDEKFNMSGRPKVKVLNRLVKKQFFLKTLVKAFIPKHKRKKLNTAIRNKVYSVNLTEEKIKPETKQKLKQLYKDDILLLQDLIQKDLSSWLN